MEKKTAKSEQGRKKANFVSQSNKIMVIEVVFIQVLLIPLMN